MKTIGAALAVGLALLSARQVRVWRSDAALWTQALLVAPGSPRPWVNLAAIAIQVGEYGAADRLLAEAGWRAQRRSSAEQRITTDLILANRAVIAIREGRLTAVPALVRKAPIGSARWELCQQMVTVCA